MIKINWRIFGFNLALLCFIVASGLLVSGSEFLVFPLWENPFVPLGNLITGMGLVCLPLLALLGIRSVYQPVGKAGRYFRLGFRIMMGLAFLWWPVGFLLSGNLANSFSGARLTFFAEIEKSQIFWGYTYFLILGTAVLFVTFGIYQLTMRFFNSK